LCCWALDFGFGLWSVKPCMAENGAGDQVNPQEGDQPEGNQQDGGQDPNLEGRVALLVDRVLEQRRVVGGQGEYSA